MGTFQNKRNGKSANKYEFRLSPLAAACAMAIAATAGHAQQADPATDPAKQEAAKQEAAKKAAEKAAQNVDTIVVTGIRRGIEAAISVKQNSSSIVEAISAEDIGKLPDSSIAESIARLPGLTAQRVAGRASGINIRGMSADFSTALLNGREQVSTGDNRGVEFDQYPSELLSGVVVYKTPDGTLIGQGLSGTVDLQTVRPLNFSKRTLSANFRHEKNGVGTDFTGKGDRFNVSYIDQFADRTIGVALGFARLKSEVGATRNERYDTANDFTSNGQTFKVNHGFKYFNDNTSQTRDGAMGVLEFKPNKDVSSVIDVYYSKFDKEVIKRGLEIQVADSWKGGNLAYQAASLAPGAVVQNGRLISGTWLNVDPLSRHIWEPRNDKLDSFGWNTKVKFDDKWAGIVDVSRSTAKRTERITEIEAGVYDTVNGRPLPGTVTVANYNDITALQYDQGNPAIMRLTDPESWGQNGYDKVIKTDDKLSSFRLTAERELDSFVNKVRFGVNGTDRKKTKTANEFFLRLPAGTSSGGALPAGTSGVQVAGTPFRTIAFDPASVFPGSYRLDPNVYADVLQKGWEVHEKANTAFGMGDIDSELMGLPVRGNIGVQAINTDQRSTAPSIDASNSSFSLVTKGKKYTDILPSVNLHFDLGNEQALRMGVARVMARARMDQLAAFQRTSIDQGKWSGSGGNPLLDPFRANALDVSYEKYFGTKGYVSAAVFYKQLKSYIFDFTDASFDFSGLPDLKGSGTRPTSFIGKFTQPRNGQGGKINGIELALSVPLNLVTPMLDGFGVVASYADTHSAIKPFGDADVRPLPGLSKQVSTLTAYYEKYGFSARVAQRHRSDFIGEIEGFGANRNYTYIKGESIVDLQFGYEFQWGFLKGLSLLAQINNSGNAKYQEFQPTPTGDNITKTDKYGKTYLFGATYKFQ